MPYMENVEKQNGTHTEEQKGIKRYHLRRKTIKFQNNLQTYTIIREKSFNFASAKKQNCIDCNRNIDEGTDNLSPTE